MSSHIIMPKPLGNGSVELVCQEPGCGWDYVATSDVFVKSIMLRHKREHNPEKDDMK